MPVYSFADLKVAQSQDVIETRLLAALLARGLPVGDWIPVTSGGVERTTVRMLAGTLSALLGARVAQAIAGRFLDFAAGDLLTFLALNFFQLTRNPATSTIELVQLSSVQTAPSNSFAPGELWVMAPSSGNRYVNLDQIELPPFSEGASAVFARFQAELPGASYSDPAGTITTMVTAPAGVSCTNLGGFDYNPAHQTGFSTGTVSANGQNPDHTGGLVFDSIRIRVDADGDVGSGAFSYSVDGGVTWVARGPFVPFFLIPAPSGALDGAFVFFSNGTAPSFLAGSIFTIFLANTILQQGADAETDASLRARCRLRWPGLSDIPTAGKIALWAQLASPEVHKVVVDADPNTPGGINITLASSAGPATAAAMIAVSDYITARLQGYKGVPASAVGGSPEETAQVRSAIAREITPAGTVDVPRATLAAVQRQADLLWLAYLRGLDIGGVVVLAEMEQAVLDAGATNISGVLLNGVASNVQLGPTEVAVAAAGTSLTATLSWRPI